MKTQALLETDKVSAKAVAVTLTEDGRVRFFSIGARMYRVLFNGDGGSYELCDIG